MGDRHILPCLVGMVTGGRRWWGGGCDSGLYGQPHQCGAAADCVSGSEGLSSGDSNRGVFMATMVDNGVSVSGGGLVDTRQQFTAPRHQCGADHIHG